MKHPHEHACSSHANKRIEAAGELRPGKLPTQTPGQCTEQSSSGGNAQGRQRACVSAGAGEASLSFLPAALTDRAPARSQGVITSPGLRQSRIFSRIYNRWTPWA